MRKAVVLAVVAAFTLSAAPPKRSATVAPPLFPHPIALFLDDLSENGARQVTFRARAVGVWFFFEEPTGVTVYRFDRGRYAKKEFLPGSTIAKAAKKYQE
jgi:hypothetical protein